MCFFAGLTHEQTGSPYEFKISASSPRPPRCRGGAGPCPFRRTRRGNQSPAAGSRTNARLTAQARAAALAIQRQSWEQGVLAVAFLEEGDDAMVVQMARASDPPIQGRRSRRRGGAPSDPLMVGEAIWRAAQITGDPALGKAVTNMLDYALKPAPRAADGTIFHTGETIWSDSFHTSPPFLACTGHYAEAIPQIEGHRNASGIRKGNCFRTSGTNRNSGFRTGVLGRRQRLGGGGAHAGHPRAARKPERRQGTTGGLFEGVDRRLPRPPMPRRFVSQRGGRSATRSRKPTSPKCWPTRSTKACAADGCRAITSRPPTGMRGAARAKVDADGFVQGVCGAPNFDKARHLDGRAGIFPDDGSRGGKTAPGPAP